MARTRTTPIQIQVQKLYRQVAEGGEHISALTLEPRIERPRTQTRRTTLNYIHQALQRLWAAGEIAAYVDAGGGLIRESQVGEPGSLAVRHPQIFNLPGGPLPPGAEREITYAERQSLPHEGQAAEEPADGQLVLEAEPERQARVARWKAGAVDVLYANRMLLEGFDEPRGPHVWLDKDTGTVFAHALSAPPPPEPAPDADEPTVEAHPEAPEEDLEEREPDEELELLRQMEMREVLARLPSDIAKCVAAAQQRMPTCPDWLPDDVLACWLVLPDVVKSLRAGQTKAANQAERSQMISTGIGRNGPVSPQALGKLVHLVRRQQFWWLRLLDFAVGDVFVTRTLHQSWIALEWDEGRNLPPEEVPPMALQLLAGLVGGYDDELLRGLVDDAEEEISEAKRSTVEQEITRLNEQVRDLKVEASESQEEVRTLKSELRAARARADNLRTSLEGLRASLEQQDSELGRKVLDLEERLAEAVSVTEGLREDRATAESTLEATREQMQAVEDDLANMRSMAARLESDKQNLQAELQQAYAGQADLRARLAEHTGVPQPENATELADTIGQLVAHLATGALERLRAGQADERDALILEIAAQVADFARRLRTLGPEPGRDELLAGPAVGEREAAPEEAPEAGADEVPEAAETDEAPMGVEDAGYVAREAPAAAEVPVPVTVAEPEPEPPPAASPAAPTAVEERLEALDVIRGFALFGILAVNLNYWFRTYPGRAHLAAKPRVLDPDRPGWRPGGGGQLHRGHRTLGPLRALGLRPAGPRRLRRRPDQEPVSLPRGPGPGPVGHRGQPRAHRPRGLPAHPAPVPVQRPERGHPHLHERADGRAGPHHAAGCGQGAGAPAPECPRPGRLRLERRVRRPCGLQRAHRGDGHGRGRGARPGLPSHHPGDRDRHRAVARPARAGCLRGRPARGRAQLADVHRRPGPDR